MPKIYVCFVWHMHQPCYKDLVSGEYRLPWTRLHALKDYYGMVKILSEFPRIRQTFNLVPSLLLQVEEYASGKAVDPFLRLALKPAEDLEEAEVRFILQYFFQANPIHLIGRYPRYAELHEAWRASDRDFRRAKALFNASALRDLQVLSQLAWFDEEFLESDPEVRALVAKGRDYTLADQTLLGEKQLEILGKVIPVYREFASSGQIEISATPFYHPILPLLCDSNIAHEANPHVPLPPRFRFPQDARLHLERSIQYVEEKIGLKPAGLWPSEGSVSDETLEIAASCGYSWAGTDNGVLAKTLGRAANPVISYRPYVWRQGGREMRMIFRDHYLSDLVGFVYSKMHAEDAANDFLHRIRENCRPLLESGRDALVPIILDGENAWEHYYRNGRPFLRDLYRKLSADPTMEAITVSEALQKVPCEPLTHIAPGSWIGANFDVWIGFEEDNKAWEYLLHARQAYEQADLTALTDEERNLALEELMIAEGSDWCWWYGPHHHTENREEFDQLYRDHLANVYRALRLKPPAELSRPILKTRAKSYHQRPIAALKVNVDGDVTSYFEWMGAGVYRVERRSGSMHGQRFLVKEIYFGAGDGTLYLRVDFLTSEKLQNTEVHLLLNDREVRFTLGEPDSCTDPSVRHAYDRILEIAVPVTAGETNLRVQISIWQDGLPMDAMPQEGWLEIDTSSSEWLED
ncbi:MAG: glycoside hydrolase family 57 protein [Bryobacteraceae bacterium]|nr:glycoside hydrolase family 57 protein [Bryobacteraceae bacterium]MDW8380189.1 glycoside hydrolase family 57 protein [Bryobacterales bacterium]